MTLEHLWPLIQVILVDLMLAADNAIVIGLAASSVPQEMRKRVIMYGIAAAAVLRIAFALVTVQLLQIIGLVLAGGLLLLWVCWKLWRELRNTSKTSQSDAPTPSGTAKSTRQAIVQIAELDIHDLADVLPAERMENDDVVHAVDEFGPEMRPDDVHHGGFHLLVLLLARHFLDHL